MDNWKNNLKLLNQVLEKNHFPRLKIITDDDSNVVYMHIFRNNAYNFLEFCEIQDLIELHSLLLHEYDQIKRDEVIQNLYNNKNKSRKIETSELRYSIIDSSPFP